jgi:hypothetical protein
VSTIVSVFIMLLVGVAFWYMRSLIIALEGGRDDGWTAKAKRLLSKWV